MLLQLGSKLLARSKWVPYPTFSRPMAVQSTPDIQMEERDGIGWILLNRPKALNALNLDMIRQMYPQLQAWNTGSVRMVVVRGAGDKAFCSGGDIRAITQEKGGMDQRNFFRLEYLLDNLVGNLRIPYVAILNGIVMGGGVGISVHGDYRVCCENTVFAMPETGIGLVPDVGGAFFLPRLKGALGMFLGLTGHRLKGIDCLHAGIATHSVNSCEIPALETELAKNLGEIPSILQAFTQKSTFHNNKGFSLEPELAWIDRVFSLGSVEEIKQELGCEKSEVAVKALKALKKASPSSLKVAFRMLNEGANLENLSQCLNMEFRLVMRCCENEDFYEGVRALLIDKDNSPKWKPNSVEEVSTELVDSYFQPLPADRELNLVP